MSRHYNNRTMFPYLFRQKSRKNIRQIVAIFLINCDLGKGELKENPIFSDDRDKIWHVNSFFIIELAIWLYYCVTNYIWFESRKMVKIRYSVCVYGCIYKIITMEIYVSFVLLLLWHTISMQNCEMVRNNFDRMRTKE